MMKVGGYSTQGTDSATNTTGTTTTGTTTAGASSSSGERLVNVRSFGDLTAGERFKATVTDISPNQVTIRLKSGESLTARSLILPEARIGEESIFAVKENFKGQVLLEMVKPDASAAQNPVIKEALANAGLYGSNENMALAATLVENGIPIDAANLHNAAFFNYSKPTVDLKQLLFLLEEGFPAEQKSIDTLNGILNKRLSIASDTSALLDKLIKTDDAALQKLLLKAVADVKIGDATLIELFKGELSKGMTQSEAKVNEAAKLDMQKAAALLGDGETGSDALLERIFASDDKATREWLVNRFGQTLQRHLSVKLPGSKDPSEQLKELTGVYKTINETASRIQTALSQAAPNDEMAKLAAGIRDNLEFMSRIGNHKEYFQIPFTVSGNENQGELIIFKDKKGRDARKANGQASALVSLDLLRLGHVEVFINKSGKRLSLQFGSDNDDTLKLVDKSVSKLRVVLSSRGYSVDEYSFKKISEPFSVVSKRSGDSGDGEQAKPARRYAFDMRV